MSPLPAYKPRNEVNFDQGYNLMIRAYGKPPHGYRWLEMDEETQTSDIYFDMCGWQKADSRPTHTFRVGVGSFPFARRIKGIKIVSPLDKFFSRTVFLDRSRGPTRLKPALKALTDSEIDDGAYSAQTVLDLRDALREAVRLLEGKNS